MEKTNFLIKLQVQGKIEEVEISPEMVESYMRKSESNLISSKILLKNDRLEESVSLAYYSMHHMLTAALFRMGIKCENHMGAIILLKELFNLDNSEISAAKRDRVDKQYYTDFVITKEEVNISIRKTEESNSMIISFISRLDSGKVAEIKRQFKEIMNTTGG